MIQLKDKVAQALGKDAAFGIESLVTGMGRQSKLMLDNLGIMVKAEDAYKKYASVLGTTVEGLTDVERKQAFVNAAMKEADKLVKGLGKEQLTASDSIKQMKTAVANASQALGNLLAPTVIKAAKGLKAAAEFSDKFLTGLKNLQEFGDTGGIEAVKEQSDRTIDSYMKQGRAISRLIGQANKLGMNGKKLASEALFDDKEVSRNKREQILFMLNAIKEEQTIKEQREAEHRAKLKEMRNLTHNEEIEMLGDIELTEQEQEFAREQRHQAELARKRREKKAKQDQVIMDLKNAALTGLSAKDAMKAAVRAETMEAVAGYVASVLKSVPFPFNVGLAAGAGAFVGNLMDKNMQFATGGDFVTRGPQMIMVGDNPGGKERVQVTPIGSPNINGPQGGVSVNINGPITNDDYVRDFIIPEIQKATRLDLA